jgi:hypothetical protein
MQAVGKHYCSIGKTDLSFNRLYLVSFLSYFFNGTTSYSAIFMSYEIENNRNFTYPLSSIDYPKDIERKGA